MITLRVDVHAGDLPRGEQPPGQLVDDAVAGGVLGAAVALVAHAR